MGEARLSVAVYSDSAYPLVNGVSKSVDLLVEELGRLGHQAELFSPQSVPGFYLPRRALKVALPFVCRPHGRFDAVHLHTPFGMGWSGLAFARRQGIPAVASYHTPYGAVAPHGLLMGSAASRAVLSRLATTFYDLCDHVVVPSSAALDFLRDSGVRTGASVVPTGLPSKPEPKPRFLHDPPTLLCVGRLAEEKSFDLAIRAHACVQKSLPGTKLTIIGDGPLKKRLVALANDLGAAHLVSFRGQMKPEDLAAEWEQADILLHPSTLENQGLAVLEALDNGLPTIVSTSSGPATLVENGVSGLITRPHPDHIAQAVLDCCENWPTMSSAAYKQASRFTASSMAERLLTVYRDAIADAKTSHPKGHAHDRTAYADEP